MSMSSKNFWRELRGDFEGQLKLHLGAEILDSEDPRSREDHSGFLCVNGHGRTLIFFPWIDRGPGLSGWPSMTFIYNNIENGTKIEAHGCKSIIFPVACSSPWFVVCGRLHFFSFLFSVIRRRRERQTFTSSIREHRKVSEIFPFSSSLREAASGHWTKHSRYQSLNTRLSVSLQVLKDSQQLCSNVQFFMAFHFSRSKPKFSRVVEE